MGWKRMGGQVKMHRSSTELTKRLLKTRHDKEKLRRRRGREWEGGQVKIPRPSTG